MVPLILAITTVAGCWVGGNSNAQPIAQTAVKVKRSSPVNSDSGDWGWYPNTALEIISLWGGGNKQGSTHLAGGTSWSAHWRGDKERALAKGGVLERTLAEEKPTLPR